MSIFRIGLAQKTQFKAFNSPHRSRLIMTHLTQNTNFNAIQNLYFTGSSFDFSYSAWPKNRLKNLQFSSPISTFHDASDKEHTFQNLQLAFWSILITTPIIPYIYASLLKHSLHTQCVTFQLPEKFDIARPTGGKLHIINGDLVPDSVLTLKKKLRKVICRFLGFLIFGGQSWR